MLTYQNNKTMTVADMKRYRTPEKQQPIVLSINVSSRLIWCSEKMRIDVESFEEWYAGQFHYKRSMAKDPAKIRGNNRSYYNG